MPRIPISGEGQVLQQGNPTSISGSSEGRMLGEAVASTGKGLANLGIAMFEKQTAEKSLKNRVDLEEADTLWKDHIFQAKIQAQDEIKAGTGNGLDIFNSFRDSNKDKLDELASRIEDPLTARMFKAKASEYAQAFGKDLTTMQRERNLELTNNKINDTVSLEIKTVRGNPALFEASKSKILNFIDSTNTLSPAQRSEYSVGLDKRIGTAVREGFYDRKDFDGALKYVESDANVRMFSAEELDKQKTEVRQKEHDILSFDHSKNEWLVQDQKRKQQELQDKNDGTYLKVILDPNSSQEARHDSIDKLRYLQGQGLASHSAVSIGDSFGKQVDEKISNHTLTEYGKRVLIDKYKLSSVDEDLSLDIAAGRITDTDALRVLTWIKDAKSDKKKKDPIFTKYQDVVASAWAPELMDNVSFDTKQEKVTQRAAAILDYNILVKSGKTYKEAADMTLEKYGKSKAIQILTGVSPEDVANPEKIPEKLKVLAESYDKLLKMGDADSKAKAREVLKETTRLKRVQHANEVDNRLKNIIKETSPPPTQPPEEGFFQKYFKGL